MAPSSDKDKKGKKAGKVSNGVSEEDILAPESSGKFTDSLLILKVGQWFCDTISSSAGGNKVSTNGKKKKDKDEEEKQLTFKEQLWNLVCAYKIPSLLVILSFLTCLLIIGGETPRFGDDLSRLAKIEDDYYGTLGVARDADTGEVKRAYKTLAKRWHPDRNPNCSSCQDTFSKIAVAYETLSDDKRRASYDESGGVATTELKSARSVPLTRDNFHEMVTYSNDVWIVQVFRPDDGGCAQFHPFWENQIQKHGHLVRFGRIDITHDENPSWLPVKIRVLPMVLKFARHLGSPEIFPITAVHETPQHLMKFVLMSFPNIGLPLQDDKGSLKSWIDGASRSHKVLWVIPGKSQEERYKSHLVLRMLAAKWSDLFEMRTAEASLVRSLPASVAVDEIKNQLISEEEAKTRGQVFFYEAGGGGAPKVVASFEWPPKSEDELVLHLVRLAELTAPALSARNAELLCRSLAAVRVYCLVVMDASDTALLKAGEELNESRTQYQQEVAEIRNSGGEVSDDEDNFMVATVKLLRQRRGLQPSVATCVAPEFSKVEQLLEGGGAMLLDMDTARVARLKGLTSYRSVYQQIAYEDDVKWEENVLHPFLSLPDCSEGILRNQMRTLRNASFGDIAMQFITLLILLEAVLRALTQKSLLWAGGGVVVMLLMLLRSPPFLRWAAVYVPARFIAPALASAMAA